MLMYPDENNKQDDDEDRNIFTIFKAVEEKRRRSRRTVSPTAMMMDHPSQQEGDQACWAVQVTPGGSGLVASHNNESLQDLSCHGDGSPS